MAQVGSGLVERRRRAAGKKVRNARPVTIKKLKRQLKLTSIVVTHDMGFAREVADRIAFMDAGQIVEVDSPEVFFANPREERTRRFVAKILRH